MVDIHCHILPAVDDGSRSWEMTREMCRIAADDGIRHIVATPHCDDTYRYDRAQCEALREKLEQASEGRIEFSIGCDFHFSYENITDAIANPERYSINGTPYLLIEFSDYGIPPNVAQLLFEFTSRGMVPIITHPERNPLLVRRPERVLEMVDAGALVQVTANSITGFWGEARQIDRRVAAGARIRPCHRFRRSRRETSPACAIGGAKRGGRNAGRTSRRRPGHQYSAGNRRRKAPADAMATDTIFKVSSDILGRRVIVFATSRQTLISPIDPDISATVSATPQVLRSKSSPSGQRNYLNQSLTVIHLLVLEEMLIVDTGVLA